MTHTVLTIAASVALAAGALRIAIEIYVRTRPSAHPRVQWDD